MVDALVGLLGESPRKIVDLVISSLVLDFGKCLGSGEGRAFAIGGHVSDLLVFKAGGRVVGLILARSELSLVTTSLLSGGFVVVLECKAACELGLLVEDGEARGRWKCKAKIRYEEKGGEPSQGKLGKRSY